VGARRVDRCADSAHLFEGEPTYGSGRHRRHVCRCVGVGPDA